MSRCLWVWMAAVFCLGGLQGFPAFAQVSVTAGVNRDTVTVGDPLTFRLRIRRGAKDRAVVLPREAFPGPFEVREQRDPVVRERDDGRVEDVRDYVLAAYRTGAFEVPPVTVQVEAPGGGMQEYETDPVAVVVRSVKPADLEDIRDVKPPVAVEARIPAWLWAAAGGLLLAAAALVWYLRRRKRRPEEVPPPPPVDWPAEVEKVVRTGLLEKGAFKEYYTLLSQVARRFLEARLGVEAMERTTYEVVRDLRRARVNGQDVDDVEALLSEADLVKFAKFRPQEENGRKAAERVRDLVKRVEARQAAGASVQQGETVAGAER